MITAGFPSNTLSDLAERIKEKYRASISSTKTSIILALEAGELLRQAKERCSHGEWLPFLERAGVHERRAQRLMQIIDRGLQSDTVSHLGGIKASLNFLSLWRMPTAQEVLIVRDPTVEKGAQSVGRGAALIWEEPQLPGYNYVCAVIPVGESDSCFMTRRPMRPMAELDGRPVDMIIRFLSAHDFTLPIPDWEICLADLPTDISMWGIVAPFWTDDTMRAPLPEAVWIDPIRADHEHTPAIAGPVTEIVLGGGGS